MATVMTLHYDGPAELLAGLSERLLADGARLVCPEPRRDLRAAELTLLYLNRPRRARSAAARSVATFLERHHEDVVLQLTDPLPA